MRALTSCIRKSQVAHAFMFSGPKGSGKSTAARAFASALNCLDRTPEGDGCGVCLSCMRIEAGGDPDVTSIRPDGNQTKIEQMQDMIKSMTYGPISGKYKVYIIEQADTLNASSENCILKILEEPPAFAVLILLAQNPNSLLQTIRSRCRMVRFRRAGTQEIEEALTVRFSLRDEQLRVVAACSQGAIGRAIGIASDPGFMEDRQVVLEALRDWSNGPPVLGLQTAELLRAFATPPKPTKENPNPPTLVANLMVVMDHILSWFSDMLEIKVVGETAVITNMDYRDDVMARSKKYSLPRLCEGVKSVLDTRRYIEGNITPQLALENLFFDLQPDL